MGKIVIFDFDGVLAASMPQILSVSKEACKRLGIRVSLDAEDVRSLKTMEYSAFAEQVGIPKAMIGTFTGLIDSIYEERSDSARIVEGMREVILAIKDKCRLAIVTGNTEPVVKRFLKLNRMHDWFDKILGKETSLDKTFKILRVVKELNGSNRSIFMVCDAASDIRACIKAGVVSIAVTWGNQNRDLLVREAPDFIVETPAALLEMLLDMISADD